MTALLALIQPYIKPLIDGIASLIEKYGALVGAYVKGRQEQRTMDKLKTLKEQSTQASEINEELQRQAQTKLDGEFGSDDGSNDRVRRNNDKPVRW